jgi:hypothetical protein
VVEVQLKIMLEAVELEVADTEHLFQVVQK